LLVEDETVGPGSFPLQNGPSKRQRMRRRWSLPVHVIETCVT